MRGWVIENQPVQVDKHGSREQETALERGLGCQVRSFWTSVASFFWDHCFCLLTSLLLELHLRVEKAWGQFLLLTPALLCTEARARGETPPPAGLPGPYGLGNHHKRKPSSSLID